ncbi:MAG: carboxypeptidase-like regulatory domain-containing protein, partial [Edaphobacter sp.]
MMKKFLGVISVLFLAVGMSYGQAITANAGSIQGTLTDPTGAVIPNANITVTGMDTGSVVNLSSNSAGFYSIGPLNPGNYIIDIIAPGFQKLEVKTVVRTGTATSGNFKLTVGQSNETIEVDAGAVQINTEQAGVSGVITQKQFDSLPVNGRNFLDFAQIQPGVQLQPGGYADGGFDPTKAGYSALSFSGISGRTTRIQLDGQDITDETVGTTIFNVSQGSVGEMQVNRATSDVSTDITSSGSVLASTRSGTNSFHGQLFYAFQDYRAGFATILGIDPPFQRNQFGGSVGGPILKDKLFFFANSERLKQDTSSASGVSTGVGSFFSAIAQQYPQIGSPARDTYSAGRIDYNGPKSTHFFFRINYEANSFVTGDNYSIYANRDNVPGFAGGADFTTGRMTHSFRGSYEKFHNMIADATAGSSSIYNPIPGFSIIFGAQGLHTGVNDNAPQVTFQSDKQLRYDGSWSRGRHQIRFGASLNRILGGGLASFFGLGPMAGISTSTLLPGGDQTDPINGYRARYVYIGNGQGYASEKAGFGLPGGGQGDWRTGV